MSEKLEHPLDGRLRVALHDLDRRVAAHVEAGIIAPGPVADRLGFVPAGRPGRRDGRGARAGSGARAGRGGRVGRLRPVLAGFAIIAILIAVGWLVQRPEAGRPARPGPTPARTGPTPAPSAAVALGIRVNLPVTRTLDVSTATAASFTGPVTKLGQSAANPERFFEDLGADGSLLTESVPREPKGSDLSKLTRDTTLGVWSAGKFSPVATSTRETTGSDRGQAEQVPFVVRSGDRVVWLQTPGTDVESAAWSLQTADLRTHQVRELARSGLPKNGHDADAFDDYASPVIIGDWVYWDSQIPARHGSTASKPKWDDAIRRARLSQPSAVQTVVRGAGHPVNLDGALGYVVSDDSKPHGYEIHRRTVPGGQADRVLVRGYSPGESGLTDLAAAGKLLAWTASSPSRTKEGEGWEAGKSTPGVLFVLDTSTGALTKVITKDEASSQESIAFTRRGVVWGNGSGVGDPGQYVLDLATGTLQKLGSNEGLSEVLANPATDEVLWRTGSEGMIWKRATLR